MFLETLACVFWGSFYHVLRVNLLNSFFLSSLHRDLFERNCTMSNLGP